MGRNACAVVGATLALVALTPAAAATADRAQAWNRLPDWHGVWRMTGPAVFDPATVTPKTGVAGRPGVRERPPYNREWEAKYAKAIAEVRAKTWPGLTVTCGLPAGMPGMMSLANGYEWAITPKQVWMIAETGGNNNRRIYTDGRKHPVGDDLLPSYTGHSVGHWEGDTLVVDTVGLRDDLIVDRTGIVLSGEAHVVERIRRTGPATLQDQITVTDPVAFTRPWTVTKTYRLATGPAYLLDWACGKIRRQPAR
jgi:hypothetical protein